MTKQKDEKAIKDFMRDVDRAEDGMTGTQKEFSDQPNLKASQKVKTTLARDEKTEVRK